MGKWSDLDGDEGRLPEGMTRVGYDADTQVYTYRDSDGSYWEGAPGCRYGRLHRVKSATPPLPSVHIPDDVEGDEQPYILHDHDDDSDLDGGGDTLLDDDDEKEDIRTTLASPDRAKLHNTSPLPHHHLVPAKTLADLPPTDADSESLNCTTLRDSLISDGTYPNKNRKVPKLNRTGTLSRLARFLSSSSSSSTGKVSRRATLNGEAGEIGERHGTNARLARSPTSTGAEGTVTAGRWPNNGGADGAKDDGRVPARKRATTFDEILGIEPRK
ncbi:hypothetical protein N657DRAFT_645831 [Parathielavia appendiculata]|uniref:Uncharacterized protein n=1 Tax=Parathielavia appendiculata TaxID=2587402 RepID=A0AAN6U0K2_9PEZI|nr:hypothetical protein N657DRAFT_645831 [Parathielavia appendiculata]